MLKIFKVNVILPKTSVTVSVKQYEHDRVTHYTFSVDFKEIKTISQSLPSTCTICFQPWQSGHHRGEIETHLLSGIVNFENTNLEIFFPKCIAYQTGPYEMTHKSDQSYLKMVCWICPAGINRELRVRACVKALPRVWRFMSQMCRKS